MTGADGRSAAQPGQHLDDDASLSRLGYAQELLRAMGGFSSFALSFSIISVLTGIMTTYDLAIGPGGPAGLGLGWPLVSVGTLFVALAMGELASAFPTAGALYHWSALLGGPGYGWFTAMMNLVGQSAIVAAIDLGCAEQAVATLALRESLTFPLFTAIVVSHGAINLLSVRLVAWANDFSATVHIVGVLVLVGALALLGHLHPFGYALRTGMTTRSDGNYAFGFVNALLLGMWTFTGFDASAHVSEETRDPARRAPWGIVSAVLVSAVAGYALVLAITLAIKDLPRTIADKFPALFVLRGALGEGWGRAAMGMAIVAMWFCGLSSVTSLSRTLYAFSRDGGLPFADRLRAVSPRFKTPHVAIAVGAAVPLLLGALSALLSSDQFLAVASLATTALYVSYALPIALGAIARHKGTWTKLGPWRLGGAGVPIAWVAVAWSGAVVLAFSSVKGGAYGLLLFAVIALLLVVFFAFVRGRFKGPRMNLASLDRS